MICFERRYSACFQANAYIYMKGYLEIGAPERALIT